MAEREFGLLTHDELYAELQDFFSEYEEHRQSFESSDQAPSIQGTLFRLEIVLDLIEKIKKRFYHLHRQANDKDRFRAQYNSFFNTYVEFVGAMKIFLGPHANPQLESTRIDSATRATTRHSRIKFPVIPLPEFDGTLTNWVEYRDKFESLVHLNQELSRIEKFHYLTSSIKLPAGQQNVLQNFALSEAAYEDAWSAVKVRYDDKRKLKAAQFNMLLSVKKMSAETAVEVHRIHDSFVHGFTALKLLGATEDDFRVHLVQHRLDEPTLKDWHKFLDDNEPTWEMMTAFLCKQWKILDSLPMKKLQQQFQSEAKSFPSSSSRCSMCNETHNLYQCQKFHSLTVNQRFEFSTEKNLCRNCLSVGHRQINCSSSRRCRICQRNHHSLLHFETRPSSGASEKTNSHSPSRFNPESPPFQPVPPPRVTYPPASSTHSSMHSSTFRTFENFTEALLSTVTFWVLDATGAWKSCRALLDSGSQSNYITSSLAVLLGIELMTTFRTVIGVNGQVSAIRKRAEVNFFSKYQQFGGTVDCSVSDDITGYLPNRPINISRLKIPSNVVLADPQFHVPGPIDMLLGTKWYHESLLCNVIRQQDQPCLVETKFGWTVGGEFPVPMPSSTFISCFTQAQNSGFAELDSKIEKFMELEAVDTSKKIISPEEKYSLNLFESTTKRDSTGRVIVQLPFNSSIFDLGTNWNNAAAQFFVQEKKRMENSTLNVGYSDYMNEYELSGHMELMTMNAKTDGYFLPHHGVIRSSSTTTKIRPVFNASSKSNTGNSLNDALCSGPTVQPDLFDILLRFLEGRFVLKSDIEKMFRQIFVEESHCKFLKIIWRLNPDEALRIYQLKTVTFGLKPAPFLATHSLNYLADHDTTSSKGAQVIKTSFYVDDCLVSFDSIDDGLEIRDGIRRILSSAHLPTRKWMSNEPKLLENLPDDDLEILLDEQTAVKTLGIDWIPSRDVIKFSFSPQKEQEITKTVVTSGVMSLYDPLGLIGPVIFAAKLFLKQLRKAKWTEKVPEEVDVKWRDFQSRLEALKTLNIDRHVLIVNSVNIQLHGFCDASEEGYGAALYLRSCDFDGNVKISLLCSKSRVSPPKKQTIARLELCAAVLLSRLALKVTKILRCSINDIIFWSDSTIVLFWIASEPSRLTTFVGNRVAVIQEVLQLLINAIWKHVRTNFNPSDKLSRGLLPDEIETCCIWWKGPEFLMLPRESWPESIVTINESDSELNQELRKTFMMKQDTTLIELIETRFSKLSKLEHCFAYIRRFAAGERSQNGFFSAEELERATTSIIRVVQKSLLPHEYEFFVNHRKNPDSTAKYPQKSSINSLYPFMGDDLIIRVGGRLQSSPGLSTNQKHQVILPHCNLVKLIVSNLHGKHFHPGPTAMLSFVRENYWPLKVKSTIREVQRSCLTCFRAKPSHATQLMGNLPAARVTMTQPFQNVAVDYAGHFKLRPSLTARSTIVKGYVAMFKCMSTGAIHLEAVTTLSTSGFISAFDRFISRRGFSQEIYSDNGTQFVGADNEFKRILKELAPKIGEFLSEKRIKWVFTTPLAPHAGGYYESGIKTMKHHLVRECGDRSFDYEQFSTFLCKVEAIINSRPLTPMSNDPNDISVLTPAHFLVGRSLVAKPELNFLPVHTNRLDKFNQLQQLQQKLWTSWYHDYLHHLQERPNEFRKLNEFHVGDLVLIMEPNLPSLKWLIGRITMLLPDKTGTVRRVRIKSSTGEKDRHVRYLCFLPMESPIVSQPAGGQNVHVDEEKLSTCS